MDIVKGQRKPATNFSTIFVWGKYFIDILAPLIKLYNIIIRNNILLYCFSTIKNKSVLCIYA